MQPNLTTQRLTLRPFERADSDDVERLAGDARVAETASGIPHPYPKGAAADWIATHRGAFENKTGMVYAITDTASGELWGAVSLFNMSERHARCEIGYWVGYVHWKKGVCSEAARALIEYAKKERGMTRIVAHCLTRNAGSARVMEKAGLFREGLLVKHVNHKGVFEDVYVYGAGFPGRAP